jgi:hypothetical protein
MNYRGSNWNRFSDSQAESGAPPLAFSVSIPRSQSLPTGDFLYRDSLQSTFPCFGRLVGYSKLSHPPDLEELDTSRMIENCLAT